MTPMSYKADGAPQNFRAQRTTKPLRPADASRNKASEHGEQLITRPSGGKLTRLSLVDVRKRLEPFGPFSAHNNKEERVMKSLITTAMLATSLALIGTTAMAAPSRPTRFPGTRKPRKRTPRSSSRPGGRCPAAGSMSMSRSSSAVCLAAGRSRTPTWCGMFTPCAAPAADPTIGLLRPPMIPARQQAAHLATRRRHPMLKIRRFSR